MLLPTTAKENLRAFQHEFTHQCMRRTQFKLAGHDHALFSEISSVLSKAGRDRFADAEHLVHLRTEFDQFGAKGAFTDHTLSESGFARLDLQAHAQAERAIMEFVASEPRLATAVVGPFGHVFIDAKFEAARLTIVALWDSAQARRNDDDLIAKVMEVVGISMVPPADYDAALVAEITDSTAFKLMTEDPQKKVFIGSDGDLRNSLKPTDFQLKFYLWTLSSKHAGLAFSNKGIIAIPLPTHRLEDPIVRFWPSDEPAFPLQTAVAERSGSHQKHLAQFSSAIKLIDVRQKKLQPWLGGGLASIFARVRHPVSTYRLFLHLGGFGCSNGMLFKPWRDVLLSVLVLFLAHDFFDLGSILQTISGIGDVNFSTWGFAALQCGFIAILLLGALSQLITGIGLLRGTFLRGMHRQYITGNTSLQGTGKTNIILRLMGHEKRQN